MIFALFIEFEAGVIGIDHSGLHMGLCDALFKFEALQYARIVVLRFIYACRDRPHPHGARLKGSHWVYSPRMPGPHRRREAHLRHLLRLRELL
jgi:hypothetical protein